MTRSSSCLGVLFVGALLCGLAGDTQAIESPNKAWARAKEQAKTNANHAKDIPKKAADATAEGVKIVAEPIAKGTGAILKPVADAGGAVANAAFEPVVKLGRGAEKLGGSLAAEVGAVANGAMQNVVVPVAGGVGKAATATVGGVAKYVSENPEVVLAVAAVATVGWAACYDGCTFVTSVTLEVAGGAATVAVFTYDPPKKQDRAPSESLGSQPQAKAEGTKKPSEQNAGGARSPASNVQELLPPFYNRTSFPAGAPRVTRYESLADGQGKVFNEFAPPVYPPVVRQAGPGCPGGVGCDAGGEFDSPRSGLIPSEVSKLSPDMRRVHAAVDFMAIPGQPVFAPLTGTVREIGEYPKASGFKSILIESKDGTTARTLYLDIGNAVKPGDAVHAGRTPIGTSKDINALPQYKNEPRHVHVQFEDPHGRRFDPFSNKAVSADATPPGMPGVTKKR